MHYSGNLINLNGNITKSIKIQIGLSNYKVHQPKWVLYNLEEYKIVLIAAYSFKNPRCYTNIMILLIPGILKITKHWKFSRFAALFIIWQCVWPDSQSKMIFFGRTRSNSESL